MANVSNAPTNVKVYPIPGTGVEVHAVFHQSNSLPATYARFQVATDANFASIIYDSNQVSITPINDNTEGVMVFSWIPASTGTYYYRLCFWDNANYTYTSWTVWNGTSVSTAYDLLSTLRPVGDYSTSATNGYPNASHYANIDETTADDTDYVFTASLGTSTWAIDKYNLTYPSAPSDATGNYKFKAYIRYKASVASSTYAEFRFGMSTGPDFSIEDDARLSSFPTSYTNVEYDSPNVYSLSTLQTLYALVSCVGGSTAITFYWSQFYIELYYEHYVFTFTPPGDNTLNIGFPSITSQWVSQNNDKFTFSVSVNDTYNKPPMVSVVVDNQSYTMDLTSRTGSSPYVYTFSKTISLEQGDHVYRYEIANVWTFVQSSDYYLNSNYTPKTPDLRILVGNDKINAWNVILNDKSLPDASEISFDSDELISSSTISVVMNADKLRRYSFRITDIRKTNFGYSYNGVSSFDINDTVTMSITAIKSIDLLKSILNAPVFGTLNEYLYLQNFDNTPIRDIIQKIIIINGVRGYERNGRFYFRNDNTIQYSLSRNDNLVSWSEDRKNIKNYIREYYTIKQYPSVLTLFTNYDASNWSGTVSNATQTSNGLLSPANVPYLLKGNGAITRSVSFKITDYDRLHLYWSPPTTSTTLTITLTQDASNYLTYTRSFAGKQGAGFVLTGSTANDELVKTISFGTQKYIRYVKGITTNACSVEAILKLNGSVVSQTAWQNTLDNQFIFIFENILSDTLELHFKSLYPVGTAYGVNVSNLTITEYAQVLSGTQTTYKTTWSKYQAFEIKPGFTYDTSNVVPGTINQGAVYTITADLTLFSVPALSTNQQYNITIWAEQDFKAQDNANSPVYTYTYYVPINGKIVNGTLYGQINWSHTVMKYYEYLSGYMRIRAEVDIVEPQYQNQYVWQYQDYIWSSSYPMWDEIDVPLNQFTKTGSPVGITQITLNATGDNFYDSLYVYASKPTMKYVEAKDDTSIGTYGQKLDIRKLDGWTSQESALLFATKLLQYFKDPNYQYSKDISITTPIELGDAVNCDGSTLYVYQIVYKWDDGIKTLFVGVNQNDLLNRLKAMAEKIENLEKNL